MHARARKERDLDGRDRRNRAHWRCLISRSLVRLPRRGRFPLLTPERTSRCFGLGAKIKILAT
jgi:hypothetical protein